jgi:hypothetical protein
MIYEAFNHTGVTENGRNIVRRIHANGVKAHPKSSAVPNPGVFTKPGWI